MNKHLLLSWLTFGVGREAPTLAADLSPLDFEDEANALFELQSRRADAVTSPPQLSADPERAVEQCRAHFRDAVGPVSFVLSRRFPDLYHFFRPRVFEQEIFDALAFFADVDDHLALPFSTVGDKGVQNYLVLNAAITTFARDQWTEFGSRDRQAAIVMLLYYRFAPLFLNTSGYDRYWLVAGAPEKSGDGDGQWSGRKDMQDGDIVFRYEMSPTEALVSVYRVEQSISTRSAAGMGFGSRWT